MKKESLRQRFFLVSFIAVFAILLASACHKKAKFQLLADTDASPLPRKVANSSDKQVIEMMRAFKRGQLVTVLTEGSDYLIGIPSSALFPEQAPELRWQGYSVLNQVISFLKLFRMVTIHVTSYVNPYYSRQREHALSLARARAVGLYLESQGVDARLIVTRGRGTDKPISSLRQGGDSGPNSRIEITFREAII